MTILLDVTALMRRELTGIGVYVRNLLLALRDQPGVEVDGTWKLSRFRGRELLKLHVPGNSAPYIPAISDLNLSGYDIFHGPDFRIPTSRRYHKVVTVHDLVIHEDGLVDPRFAAEGQEKLRRMLLGARPDRIITVSEYTRCRLIELYPELEPITTTVHLGIDHTMFCGETGMADATSLPFHRPYILSAGTVEKRKNLERTIHAFEIVHERMPGLHLVIAGGNGHGSEEIASRISESPCHDMIHRLGFVPDPLLAALYRYALCMVYPSLYEGFGIPIIEAMASGCPVITSNCGAMAEVAANAGILVDPLSAEDIAHAILELTDDPARRQSYIAAGQKHASSFTWERCARETVEVYRRIVG